MNKELELEAERYARRFEEQNELGSYNGESLSIEDRIEMEAFAAGATSKWVEKQKLEFAIEQLKKIKIAISDKNPFTVYNIAHQIQELEQKIQNYETN